MKTVLKLDRILLYTYYCAIQVENIPAIMPAFDYDKPVAYLNPAGLGFCQIEQNGLHAIVPTNTLYEVESHAAT